MKTKAYLIDLSGMGDCQVFLVDQVTWEWFDGEMNGKDYSVPTKIVDDYLADSEISQDRIQAAVAEFLSLMKPKRENNSSWDNDIALNLPPSRFNGESFNNFYRSVKELNAFVKKHDLELIEAYEGYIY